MLFGIGWTPCIRPTLAAVQVLSFSAGTAPCGAFLAFIYGLGLGIPFLIVAALFQPTMNVLAFFRRNARLVTRIGGLMLVALGLVEVTGTWTAVIAWMHTHWFETYSPQLQVVQPGPRDLSWDRGRHTFRCAGRVLAVTAGPRELLLAGLSGVRVLAGPGDDRIKAATPGRRVAYPVPADRLAALSALADGFPPRFLAHPGMPGADRECGEDDG